MPNAHEPGGRLVERVYDQMLQFIFQHELARGDQLPTENELSRMMGASRPIVREALSRLKADGLIEVRAGARTYLRQQPDERAIHHLRPAPARARLERFEVRIALEPAAARIAAQVREEQNLEILRNAARASSGGHQADQTICGEHLTFHRAVAAATRNAMFLIALDALDDRLGRPARSEPGLVIDPPDDESTRIASEHLAVVDAISRGDAASAEAAMRLHLLQARTRALRTRL